ncbi:MAG: hypothetical protein ACK5WP_09430 [Neisseriaceae bacterium]
MNKNMIKIDNSKQIYYSINEGLFRLDENNKPYYQTVIIVPIISIMEEIKAAEIQIFGSTKDWFTPERITIESESRKLTKDEFLKKWKAKEDLLPEFVTLFDIEKSNEVKIGLENYKIIKCLPELKKYEKDIVKSIFKEIIPLISAKKSYTENWQLNISQIEDNELTTKFINYKNKHSLLTSKALKELLKFAFICLDNDIRVDENGLLFRKANGFHFNYYHKENDVTPMH